MTTAEENALPTVLQSLPAQPPEPSKAPAPVWKARHYNRQLARQNLAVLAKGIAELNNLQPVGARLRPTTIQDIFCAVAPVYDHFYTVINAGTQCPFMSEEEVVEYVHFAGALFGKYGKDTCETVGGASQVHALCEIFKTLDDEMVHIDAHDIVSGGGRVRDLVTTFREVAFPRWIKGRMIYGDTSAKACLVTGRKWGLEKTDEYKAALETLLKNAEGHMNCRYDDYNNCRITNACRVRDVVRVDFEYSGNRTGPLHEHDPRSSVIGWEQADGAKTRTILNVQISRNTNTTMVGSIEFNTIPTRVSDRELWFRFSGQDLYTRTYLNFDHPDAKLFPSYWERNRLCPVIVKMGAGLSLRKSEIAYNRVMGEIGVKDSLGYNMFCSQRLQQSELAKFQELFDASLRKKFTRDRKDGGVPDRLLITRGLRCQNVQNWTEYSRRRWQIKEELDAKKGLLRSIRDLKTAHVLPDEDKYRLDADAHEELLFHGTNDAAAESITRGDFLVDLAGSNAGTLYGRGVYLAESVSKSDEYTKENGRGERCILVCRATLGYVNYNDEVAPNVDALVKSCTHGPYHCVLGDREKCRGTYREIMVYDHDQVYPEYVIWYTRVYEDK